MNLSLNSWMNCELFIRLMGLYEITSVRAELESGTQEAQEASQVAQW